LGQLDESFVFKLPQKESADLALEGSLVLPPIPEPAEFSGNEGASTAPVLMDEISDLIKLDVPDGLLSNNQRLFHELDLLIWGPSLAGPGLERKLRLLKRVILPVDVLCIA
jgi:hypothetical protein